MVIRTSRSLSLYFSLALLALFLTACSSVPPKKVTAPKVNPITRLPPQTKPVPKPSEMPAFGSDEFNRIKDEAPESPPDVSQVPDAEPVEEPRSKFGNKSSYTVLGETYRVMPSAKGFTQTGKASWYGKKFHGLKTSSGEKYDMYKMTAAHTRLPLPTYVRVTNLANDKNVVVKVNDRGPFHSERIMDLSYAAAARLDFLKAGTARVRIEVVEAEEFQRKPGKTDKAESPLALDIPKGEPRFYIQVGAFSELANAAALQTRLLAMINAPIVIARDESETAISRVQIGPFSSMIDADKTASIIRDANLGEPITLKR